MFALKKKFETVFRLHVRPGDGQVSDRRYYTIEGLRRSGLYNPRSPGEKNRQRETDQKL
jgi:hypothetical protein